MSRLYIVTLLVNLYAEYIFQNGRLYEAQAGTKVAGKNINNLRYADDTTLMAESKELKSLLMKERNEKVDLKLNFQKTNIMASGFIISWLIDGETVEAVRAFTFLCSKITAEGDCSHEIKKTLASWKKCYGKPRQCIKKKRHHFTNRSPYSQSYGFTANHV